MNDFIIECKRLIDKLDYSIIDMCPQLMTAEEYIKLSNIAYSNENKEYQYKMLSVRDLMLLVGKNLLESSKDDTIIALYKYLR